MLGGLIARKKGDWAPSKVLGCEAAHAYDAIALDRWKWPYQSGPMGAKTAAYFCENPNSGGLDMLGFPPACGSVLETPDTSHPIDSARSR